MGTAPRDGIITITAPGAPTQTIVATKAGASAALTLDRTVWLPDNRAQNITVGVTANGIWNMPVSNVPWLIISHVTPANRNGNGSFRINVGANTGSSADTGTITVTSGNVTQTINVTQSPPPPLNQFVNVNWIMHHDSPRNTEVYVTASQVTAFGFTNAFFGMTRDMSGGGQHGELFALSGNNWVRLLHLTFSTVSTPFSDDLEELSALIPRSVNVPISEENFMEVGDIEPFSTRLRARFGSEGWYDFMRPESVSLSGRPVLSDFHTWRFSFIITFNGNGGRFANNATTQTRTVPQQLGITRVGNNFPPDPARIGHEFVGWFNTSDMTGGTQITANTSISGNRAFYARWRPSLTIVVPANNAVIDPGRDLFVSWASNAQATHTITLRNLNTGSTPINNQEVRDRFNFTIGQQHLTPGHRYRLDITATIDNITSRRTVELDVRSDTPVFRLGLSEWSINNGATRLLTYATYPATHPSRETVELYIASDNTRRTVDARYSYNSVANGREQGIANRIREARNSTPRVIINAGFFDFGGSSISLGMAFNGTHWYQNASFIDRLDTGNRLVDGYSPGNFTTLFYYSDGTTELHNAGTFTRQAILDRAGDSNKRLVFAISGTIPSGTVYNGVVLNRSNPQYSHYFRANDAGSDIRTMIGVTANGSIIFLTADTGRIHPNGQGIRSGLSVDVGANILRNMGAITILNLDGGPSTQLFYRNYGRVIHPPFDISDDPDDPPNTPIYRRIGSVFLVW